uniref:S.griseus DNA sequence for ORF's 1-6 n=1 Tax=Streptomyces griseus TaxID=1911 RepID=Q54195_STRGR|nr:unnamed protein product [Streptomyces griseus]prf//2009361A ORF 2 in daunorubicin synthesis gene [Streptomyces griseus]
MSVPGGGPGPVGHPATRGIMEPNESTCRICGGRVRAFFDFGRQPLSDHFPTEEEVDQEFFFRLAAGMCAECTMVQLLEEVPRDRMFRYDYPYRSSGSEYMREHFRDTARRLIETELGGPDPFCVEIGSNDGVMLRTVRDAGISTWAWSPPAHSPRCPGRRGCRCGPRSSRRPPRVR